MVIAIFNIIYACFTSKTCIHLGICLNEGHCNIIKWENAKRIEYPLALNSKSR